MPTLPTGYTIDLTGKLVRIQSRGCTILEFMSRLSLDEEVALTAVRIDASSPLSLRAALETLKDKRSSVTNNWINLDDPRTQQGAVVVLGVLSSLPDGTPGRIDPADVPARLSAWLADYPQPGDLIS